MYSDLVSYFRESPNKSQRKNKTYNPEGVIDAIVVHHVAGVTEVEPLGALFASPERQASSNYRIGNDGRIACFAPEEFRSWCSGNRGIDHRAVTVEVSNSGGAPDWPVGERAWQSLVQLCADVCRRHRFRLHYTGDKEGNLHMHKWYQPTACPGPYLEKRFAQLAEEVNRLLDGEVFYRVQVGAFREKQNAAAQLEKLKADGYEGFIVEVRRDQ